MFVRIDRTDLLNGINMAMRAVGTGQNQPILKCLLFEIIGDGVRLTSNNQEMRIETAVIKANPSMDIVEGKVALDARMFSEIIKSLPEGEVEIGVDEKHSAKIKSGRSKFNMPGSNPDDFPVITDAEPVGSFTIDCALLRNMVKQTNFCVSQDNAKPVLTGEKIKVTGGRIEICALDMFRVAFSQGDTDYDGEDFGMVVPGRTLLEVTRIMPTAKESKVTMSFDDRKIWFGFDGAKVMSRLLEGDFLDYNKFFVIDLKSRVTANRADLLAAMERATLIGERKTPASLEIEDDMMKISSRTEIGEMDEDMPIEREGENIIMRFNAGYIMDALRAITTERVIMDFSGQMSPCILHADDNTEDCKYLVVPLRPEPVAETTTATSTFKAAA